MIVQILKLAKMEYARISVKELFANKIYHALLDNAQLFNHHLSLNANLIQTVLNLNHAKMDFVKIFVD